MVFLKAGIVKKKKKKRHLAQVQKARQNTQRHVSSGNYDKQQNSLWNNQLNKTSRCNFWELWSLNWPTESQGHDDPTVTGICVFDDVEHSTSVCCSTWPTTSLEVIIWLPWKHRDSAIRLAIEVSTSFPQTWFQYQYKNSQHSNENCSMIWMSQLLCWLLSVS